MTGAMIELTREGRVYVLRMNNGENRFSPAFFEEVDKALAEVEKEASTALVTVGEGKFYSNGIDLDWVASSGTDVRTFVHELHGFLGRLLSFPRVTVAAINGHAFAGGAVMTLAQDFRIMRTDRGYWCLPEVDIDIAFTEALAALIRAKLSPSLAHEAMVTGKRYSAVEGVASGLFADSGDDAEVLPKAIELAERLADKGGGTLGAIKRAAYARELGLLNG